MLVTEDTGYSYGQAENERAACPQHALVAFHRALAVRANRTLTRRRNVIKGKELLPAVLILPNLYLIISRPTRSTFLYTFRGTTYPRKRQYVYRDGASRIESRFDHFDWNRCVTIAFR